MRPHRCVACGAASRPIGEPLAIIGHGLRARQVRGPARVGAPPKTRTLWVRRYLCLGCAAVLTVVPREVIARKHFAVTAIGLAFAMVGLLGLSQGAAWAAVSGWGVPYGGWVTLRRWARSVVSQELLRCVRAAPREWSLARVAERVATTLIAQRPAGALSGAPLEDVFAGAALVAHLG